MKLRILLISLVVVFQFSCKKKTQNPINNNADKFQTKLFASYENPPGGNPSLVADMTLSSPEIHIEAEPVLSEANGRILFNYSAVTFKDGKTVYSIDSLITERKNHDVWIIDDENFLSWSFSKSLDIIMVLDVSSSLGENMQSVKDNMKEIVSNILEKNDEARVGILKFSRGSVYKELSSSIYELNAFIDENSTYDSPDIGSYELEGRSETALYETVNNAVEILNNSDAMGKGILTFTDGISNFQFDPQYFTADVLISKLEESSISNYTIGFEGNQGTVDKNSLQSIAINGDFSFPKNLTDLNTVFLRFSNNVASVYDLVYETNNSKFNGTQEYRFLFKTVQFGK
jgi:hypothetical protein